MLRPIIGLARSLTFSDYFKLTVEVDELVAHFGYSFQAEAYDLPSVAIEPQRLNDLQTRLHASQALISLTNEMARREFMIAPVLLEVALQTQAKVRVEYALELNDQLKGTLDYYLQAKNNLLIVKAKNADLQKGFTQLAVELIALDQWTDSDIPYLYGAVSIGDIWRFGILERQPKKVIQDFNLYRVPTDVAELLAILVAILTQ